jgi:hypothetical protein
VNVCGRCGHDFGNHACVATTKDPMNGGIILCPRRGCRCYSTWSPNYPGQESHMPRRVPDSEELADLHERIWAQEEA